MNKPSYVYETYIRSTPEEIWKALTSAEFTRRYFHNMAIESDWQPGSRMCFTYADGREGVEGKILEADEPNRLCYSWRFLFDEDIARERHSRVTYEIEAMGKTCRLRVIHDDFDEDSKVYPMIREGWAPILCSLKSLLETGEALEVAGNEEEQAA